MDLRECIWKCDALLKELENDRAEISRSLQGDLLEAYQEFVDQQIATLRKIRSNIRNAIV